MSAIVNKNKQHKDKITQIMRRKANCCLTLLGLDYSIAIYQHETCACGLVCVWSYYIVIVLPRTIVCEATMTPPASSPVYKNRQHDDTLM